MFGITRSISTKTVESCVNLKINECKEFTYQRTQLAEFTVASMSDADQVDSMSDAELRTKLAEHGFPFMPITASTRTLLVKKMKSVLENKRITKNKPRTKSIIKVENRRSLARYSRGEASDLDKTNNAKKKRGRQATTKAMVPLARVNKPRRPPPKQSSPARTITISVSKSKEQNSKGAIVIVV